MHGLHPSSTAMVRPACSSLIASREHESTHVHQGKRIAFHLIPCSRMMFPSGTIMHTMLSTKEIECFGTSLASARFTPFCRRTSPTRMRGHRGDPHDVLPMNPLQACGPGIVWRTWQKLCFGFRASQVDSTRRQKVKGPYSPFENVYFSFLWNMLTHVYIGVTIR